MSAPSTEAKPVWKTTEHDRTTLRELARRHLDIANTEKNAERRDLWYRHNDLQESRPMVLIESFPATDDYVTDADLVCEEDWARGVERWFRVQRCHFEKVGDDDICEPYFNVNWRVATSDYGVTVDMHYSPGRKGDGVVDGSAVWEPALKDVERDFHKLRHRTFSVDREGTEEWKAHLASVFGDILPVRIRGGFWWTTGMTIQAIQFVGLQNLMMMMYDDPDGLHRVMGFLRDDTVAYAEWLEREGLLSLNNENDYIGSGSRGYTRSLPREDWREGDIARLKDLWVLSESQETVGVGPSQFEEFIFPYQKAVTEKFGLLYYGCCEPVHSRWEVLRKFENLRSASVSPWCDEEFMAEALGRDYVYSRKPNPAFLATTSFDAEAIREGLTATRDVCAKNGCALEFIQKDISTVCYEPERLFEWARIAMEVARG